MESTSIYVEEEMHGLEDLTDVNLGDEVNGEGTVNGKNPDELTDDEIMSMSFHKEEDAYTFYKRLGFLTGFGIRRSDLKKNRQGEPSFRSYVCSSAGIREERHSGREVRTRCIANITRCGCKAGLRIGKNHETQRWEVRGFEREHNHDLISPTLVHRHRCHRSMTAADIVQANALKQCGVSSRNVMSVLAQQRGGYENLGFTKKDFFNQQNLQRRLSHKGRDAESALAYLAAKRAMNSSSCYRYTTDDDGRLENLFWADSKCVLDYEFFSDVLSFDATYNTNYYQKPLVIFIGCNNHRQTVLFGSALMVNETSESYVWLLNAFLECHEGRHPRTVISDGDNAMRSAITNVFPNSHHRLCHWHLDRNCTDNIKDDIFLNKYRALRDLECTEEQFIAGWKQILAEHGVPESCKWATDNFSKRRLWSYCFLAGQFCAGMKTTQRSEGMNSFVKDFLKPEMKIYEVLELFDKELIRWRQKVYKEEYKSHYTTPVLRTTLESLERHAAEVYTPANYLLIVETLRTEQLYFVTSVTRSECGMFATYNVQRYGSKIRSGGRTVAYQKEEHIFKCSCRHFEEYGLPCAHLIAAFKVEHIENIPKCCILERWMKGAASEVSVSSPSPTSEVKDRNMRYAALSSISNHLCTVSSKDSKIFLDVRDKLIALCVGAESSSTNGSASSAQDPSQPTVLDPEFVRAKGSGQRGPDGKKPTTRRLCSACQLPGHKVTTCPTKRARTENVAKSSQPSQSQPQSSQPSQSQPQSSQPPQNQPQSSQPSYADQIVRPPYYHMQPPPHVLPPYYFPFMQPPIHPAYYQNHVGQTSAHDAHQVPFTANQYHTQQLYGSQSVRDALKFVNRDLGR